MNHFNISLNFKIVFIKIDQGGSVINCKKSIRPNSKTTNEHNLTASKNYRSNKQTKKKTSVSSSLI